MILRSCLLHLDECSVTSAGVFYGDENLKKNLFAAITYDFDVNGYATTRVSVQYKMVQQQELADGGENQTGGLVSYSINAGNVIYKVQYQTLEDDTNFNLGFEHKLSYQF